MNVRGCFLALSLLLAGSALAQVPPGGGPPLNTSPLLGSSASASLGLPSLYLGQVATRSYIPSSFNLGTFQLMGRTTHFARSNITSLALVVPNFYVSQSALGEVASGATSAVTATVEYPLGTIAGRFTFNKSNTGTVPNGGLLVSDNLAVTIPYGATFYIRQWVWNTVGLVYTNQFTMPTDTLVSGATTPDLTGGGALTNIGPYAFYPAALIAQTTRPSVFLSGDSRTFGFTDTIDAYGDLGEFARSVGPSFGYINAGVSNETAQIASTSFTNRLALSQYCSHIIEAHGGADIRTGGLSAAQTAGYVNTLVGLYTGKEVWTPTFPPFSTSTDGWATTTNQTTAGTNSIRVTYNTNLRAGGTITAIRGFIELAGAVESSLNSGLWAAPGYTGDGIHEIFLGTLKEQSAGVVPVGSFTR